VIDQVLATLREPGPAVIAWSLVAFLVRVTLPPRFRVLALSGAGAVVGVMTPVLFGGLRAVVPPSMVAIPQVVVLFASLTLFLAPALIALDRAIREYIAAFVASQRKIVRYLLPVLTGLLASFASLGALWWVTDVHGEIRGGLDLALFGGVFTACVGLVRADRAVSSRPPDRHP
jgi:hypothetical protein